MRKIVVASIVLGLMFAICSDVATAQAKKTTPTPATPKPMKGKVVSLDDVLKGKTNLQLNKERAKELLEQGSPLVFLFNKKIYFVQTESGDFAFKKLADYAHRQNVGIVGKTKTVTGINIIIMSKIEAMD